MGAMLKSSLAHYPAVFAASLVLVCVVALFAMIGVWVFRPSSRPVFEHASRMPLEEKEKRE